MAMKLWAKVNKGLALCYAAVLALWLAVGVAAFVYDRAAPSVSLPMEDAQMSGLQEEGEGWYVSTDGDPQLVYEGLDMPVRRVVLVCEYEDVPGEVDVYYTRGEGQGFSPRKREYGRPLEGGGYEFTLPPGHVQDLRVDPTSLANNRMRLVSVEVNPRQSFGSYFAVSLRGGWPFVCCPHLRTCAFAL